MSTWMIIPKDDDVVHGFHKYLSKEWVNGKWKYIYYDAKRQAKNVKNKMENAVNRTKRKINKAIGVDERNSLERAKIGKYYADIKNQGAKFDRLKGRDGAEERVVKTGRDLATQNTRVGNAQKKYDQTLLGKVDKIKNAASNAIDKVTGNDKKYYASNRITNRSSVYVKRGKEDHGKIYVDEVKSSYTPNNSRVGHTGKQNLQVKAKQNRVTNFRSNSSSQYTPSNSTKKKDTSVNSKKKRKNSQGRNAVKAKQGR